MTSSPSASHSTLSTGWQTAIGTGLTLAAIGLAVGASGISSEAGYGGVGPNFLPWVVSLVLLGCGVGCVWHARTGGFRALEPASGAGRGDWAGFAWVSAGLLLNALLITRIGFILSCALCFVLAVRGFKQAEGRLDWSARAWGVDACIGVAIAAPVYWMFTQFLDIQLPGLTSSGWF